MNEATQRVYDHLARSNERWQRRQISRFVAGSLAILAVLWFVTEAAAQRVVKAQAGETVEKVAERLHMDPVELAKFNGLLPNSVLPYGRELRLPTPPCELTLADAPAIRGIKLGMPESAITKIMGKQFEPDSSDPIYIRGLNRRMNDHPAEFSGIEYLAVRSFDNRVSAVYVTYDVTWKDIKEFVENFGPKLDLPSSAWDINMIGEATMTCKDFTLKLKALGHGELALTDNSTPKRIADLKLQYEEDKKKAIKP